jgi:hypothetical protein
MLCGHCSFSLQQLLWENTGTIKRQDKKRVFQGISLSVLVTSDWRSDGRDMQLRILGRTCFMVSLPFGVLTNSQIVLIPSGDERYSRTISCPWGDAIYDIIIPFIGSIVTTCS